jgi:hypothetical protein
MDLNDTIELLVSARLGRVELFPFERAVRLLQLQTWIYYPAPSEDMVRMAGRIVATKFLQTMELGVPHRSLRQRERKVGSDLLREFLERSEYRLLFDSVIGEYGGWTHLLDTLEPSEFDERLRKRIDSSETVCEMIDYRFRYLDHGELIESKQILATANSIGGRIRNRGCPGRQSERDGRKIKKVLHFYMSAGTLTSLRSHLHEWHFCLGSLRARQT